MILLVAVVYAVLWLFVTGLTLRQIGKAWKTHADAELVFCVIMLLILIFCLVAMVSVL